MRVLVTGSRDWVNNIVIAAEMQRVTEAVKRVSGTKHTLIVGDCPTGADKQAREIAEAMGWDVRMVVAKWDEFGKKAGFIRNLAMVRMRPDICLAFIKHRSKGATMTARLAHSHGIPVRIKRNDYVPGE
jgi:hypothetical protein